MADKFTFFFFVLCTAIVAGCSSSDNEQGAGQAKPDIDFCSFRTYDYFQASDAAPDVVIPDQPGIVGEADPLVKDNISLHLTELNMSQTTVDPDLKINIAYNVSNLPVIEPACVGADYGWYGYWYNYGCGYYVSGTTPGGTALIDFVDRVTNEVVFRGLLLGTVETDKALAPRIEEVVNEMFKDYPISSGDCP